MNTKVIRSGIHHYAEITTDRIGRMSIVIYAGCAGGYGGGKRLVDVELPARTGEFKDSFKPTVKVHPSVDIEKLPE